MFVNNLSDSFLKTTIDNLGLDEGSLEVLDFSAHAPQIKKYDGKEGRRIEVSGQNLKLVTVVKEAVYSGKLVSTTALNASDYYNASFISEYSSNMQALSDYEANPIGEFSYPYPNSVELIFGQELTEEEVTTIEYTLIGTPVNVAQKVSDELEQGV